MKKVLFMLCFSCISVLSYGQYEGTLATYSPQPLKYETYTSLNKIGEHTILDTLQKPYGYIISLASGKSAIAVKEGEQWGVMTLNIIGSINADSTARFNLFGTGADELLLFTSHYSEHDEYEEYDYRLYVVDLDKKTVVLEFYTIHFLHDDEVGKVIDIRCDYKLEKEKLILSCNGKKREVGGDDEFISRRSEYQWINGQFKLVKK